MARTKDELTAMLNDSNVRRGLDWIAANEGTAQYPNSGYSTQYTGRQFEGLQHPNAKIQGSTAAGRYQFLHSTWAGLAGQYGLEDFSPRSQDIGALALLDRLGALDDFAAGNYEAAVPKIKSTWVAFAKGSHKPAGDAGALSNISAESSEQTPMSLLNPNAGPEAGLMTEPDTGLMSIVSPDGQRGIAASNNPAELSLFNRIRGYNEEVRGRMLAIAPMISGAQKQAQASVFSKYPTDFDSSLLDLLDQI
jgi:muramidase (phage lysozyme)